MKIAIIGLGKFGKVLTEHLSKENHDITVIDSKMNVVNDIVNQYDVMGYCGNGASLETQQEAGVSKADVVIASTSSDELNILCCLVAKKLGAGHTIARIRNPEYAEQAKLMKNELGINLCVNPDLDTAMEILRIIRFPSAIKVESFAGGKVDLVEIKLEKNSLLKDLSLMQIRDKFQVKILVCAVKRGEDVIIPKGNFVLQENDEIFITADSKEIEQDFRKLKIFNKQLKNAIIIGGGRITRYLSEALIENGVYVKIVDHNPEICNSLSETLPQAVVLNGEGTNHKLLLEEGIQSTDAVITLTNIDETNIVVSTFAKSLEVDKVITKVNSPDYDLILNKVGLESVISPREIFSSNIIRCVRGLEGSQGTEFRNLYRLVNNKVEALEFGISEAAEYTSKPIKELKLKHGFLLATIIRGKEVIIPSGKDTIEVGDSVIIITTESQVKDVMDILE